MNKKKEFVYEYPYAKEHLLDKLNGYDAQCHDSKNKKLMLRLKRENKFFLCVKYVAHTGGDWYIANIEENEAGATIIRGTIVPNPDDEGRKRKPDFAIVLFYICLWPVAIVHFIARLNLYLKTKKQRALAQTEMYDNLNKFMLEYLGCKEI